MSREITIYHSPDADDAFMFYGIVNGEIAEDGYTFRSELKDIESLNHLAEKGEVEATAISVHAFPYLQNRYAILRSGASMGGPDYGPRLVARNPIRLEEAKTIGIPGRLTSAALSLRIYLAERGLAPDLVSIHFDKIQDAVRAGEVDAGLIIHEGQITHERDGLTSILDLGVWWWEKNELPLPLGVNIVRKDLGGDAMSAVQRVLSRSINHSLAHRKAAIDYALTFGRGLDAKDADTFIGMYVNENTVDLGELGMRSIELFLKEGADRGFIPRGYQLEYIS